MRIIFRGGENEMVEIEEVGGGSVKVSYRDFERDIESHTLTNIRESPTIVNWLMFGQQMILGVREGTKPSAMPTRPPVTEADADTRT